MRPMLCVPRPQHCPPRSAFFLPMSALAPIAHIALDYYTRIKRLVPPKIVPETAAVIGFYEDFIATGRVL